MRKYLFVVAAIFLLFLAEFFIFNFGGRFWTPDLLIVGIVFFAVAFGLRHSLAASLGAGLLKDSFSTHPVGAHLFAFVACAFAAVWLKRYVYQAGSEAARLFLIAIVAAAHFLVLVLLFMKLGVVESWGVVGKLFFSQMAVTLAVALPVFRILRICVLKLFV
ncbi:MAG: rod shape-determining protein MreD [Candidatus Omnitrophica bacterium]|nr:rod shape-determining protein MreD [Candidatus Omnitrophota bacterium]